MQILLRGAEVDGATVDVTIRHGRIVARPSAAPDEVIDAGGGALIGGLHDHHLHLLAMAAADHSLDLATATDPASFDEALAIRPGTLAGGGWLRAVGYDDQVHGPLDRRRLDHLAPDRPVRVQHRSGALWVLNSRALTELPGTPAFPADPTDPVRRDSPTRRPTTSRTGGCSAVTSGCGIAYRRHRRPISLQSAGVLRRMASPASPMQPPPPTRRTTDFWPTRCAAVRCRNR
jgi:hypothetical protein